MLDETKRLERLENQRIQNSKNFLAKCKEKYGDRYDYSKVEYVNNHTKITVICPIHGEIKVIPHYHLSSITGCSKCSVEKRAKESSLGLRDFIDRSNRIHNFKYDYSLAQYTTSSKNVKIICPEHGEFEQRAGHHLLGHGCNECSILIRAEKKKIKKEEFLERATTVHGDKYDYTNSQPNGCENNIEIFCKKHGYFNQTIGNHLSGKGCLQCSLQEPKTEILIKDFFESNDIKFKQNDREILGGRELDFLCHDRKIAIEVNGMYWHSELAGKDRNYHLDKTRGCKKSNIQLIHIMEVEITKSPKIVFSKLRSIFGLNKKRIYARKCEIGEINTKTKNKFLKKYHIQGEDKSSVKLGLFYKNRLVAVMTFCKNRAALGKKHKNGEWELSRYATISLFSIVGGAGKLLKYFERNWNPRKITSYADKRWSSGNLYKVLGFEKKLDSKPNYWYFDKTNIKPFHRYKFRKSELPKLLENFDPNLTEWENMVNNGWNRIWDCGNMVFEKNEF